MTVGSPAATSKKVAGLSYQCMSGGSRGTIVPTMPDKPCSSGIFTTHHFPPLVPYLIQSTRSHSNRNLDAGTVRTSTVLITNLTCTTLSTPKDSPTPLPAQLLTPFVSRKWRLRQSGILHHSTRGWSNRFTTNSYFTNFR
jgi:hypothetical protein